MSRLGRGRQFPISIIVADVDGLKQINDRQGHAAGDDLLKRTALVLKEAFRADEVVARMGGDEFAVLLPKTDATTARAVLDRVEKTGCFLIMLAQSAMHLSFSLGAATAKDVRFPAGGVETGRPADAPGKGRPQDWRV